MPTKLYHEIRDPVHVFIQLDADERDVLDSRSVQRLRNIHQLAMEYMVYPGATHKRFEHALGVMELASRVFDIITRNDLVHETVRQLIPEIFDEDKRRYWRRVLRMAALCHDIGHLPFSHAAEDVLLPEGWTHETLTADLIRSTEMQDIWNRITPPLRPEDIVKLAVGPKKLPNEKFTDWEAILSEIIVGDAFGVDRMDYLLRDSLHAGVQYGRFDHHRLVDTLRILPKSSDSEEPTLGIESGGLHSAEALLLARYSMFTQLYLHPVRRAYHIHLKDFLRGWLPEAKFPIDVDKFLEITDIEVLAALAKEAVNHGDGSSHDAAVRIVKRHHFKTVYSQSPTDLDANSEPGKAIYTALAEQFGADNVRLDEYAPHGAVIDFPVLQPDKRIVAAQVVSGILKHIPPAAINFVFIEPTMRDAAQVWLRENLATVLAESVG